MLTKAHGLIVFCQVFVAISVLYLIVGLIKPKWVWLGDHAPGRHVVILISLMMFMASWTGYSMLTLKPLAERQAERQQATLAQAQPPTAAQVFAEAPKPDLAAPAPSPVAPTPTEVAKPVVEPSKVNDKPTSPAKPNKTKAKTKKSAESTTP